MAVRIGSMGARRRVTTGRYRNIVRIVAAEQFLVDQPWPVGVRKTKRGHAFESQSGFPVEIADGDWIVTHENGVKLRVTSAIFRSLFEPA